MELLTIILLVGAYITYITKNHFFISLYGYYPEKLVDSIIESCSQFAGQIDEKSKVCVLRSYMARLQILLSQYKLYKAVPNQRRRGWFIYHVIEFQRQSDRC